MIAILLNILTLIALDEVRYKNIVTDMIYSSRIKNSSNYYFVYIIYLVFNLCISNYHNKSYNAFIILYLIVFQLNGQLTNNSKTFPLYLFTFVKLFSFYRQNDPPPPPRLYLRSIVK